MFYLSSSKVTSSDSPCHSQPCGANTMCTEWNGPAVCSCLPGYVGDPFTVCEDKKEDVDQKPRCYPAQCGRNEECRIGEDGTDGCRCKPGYRGSISFGCVQCETKFNCDANQTCNNQLECVDPCPGVCGPNDDCYVFNHKASCRPKGSQPKCSSDVDCPSHEACDGYKCVDPCLDLCGNERADCQVVNHEPNCTCKPGFYGSPYRFCITNGAVE